MPRSLQIIKTGEGAHAFRAAGDGRHLYVSNRVVNTISKIDMKALEVTAQYLAVAPIAWTSLRMGVGFT